ncbi:golgi re-assembly stacking protein 1, putative [Plasmodium gallinaceum]|uniref:Golgi re-assembly stacking protein 1, putative n=1 Tax=Plasmodium gallinaceum TaxID=5849 RepID=A0A1J1GY46_PLAGA|nr:golgi re-assembly stacking protein 1, putative [Plasmodium gallinaceum]CRG97184.1 golgi re-assembly stacking protein 1, putative [Plasmodium gallinaceum]
MGAEQTKEIRGGYRILRIYENSPASESDIEIFFDYIIQIDDLKLIDSSQRIYECFMEKIRENENKVVLLLVYNCRYKKVKEVKVTPRKWKGNGLLGLNINYEFLNAMNEGTRILDIFENSPAFKSDLNEYSDFIIGCDNNIFRNQEELMNYININYMNYIKENKEEKYKTYFYVYNCITEKIRRVEIEPNNAWGGKGLLGCNIANGFLHKIPLCKENILKKKTDVENGKESNIHYIENINEETNNKSNNKYAENDSSNCNNIKNVSCNDKINNTNTLNDHTIKNNEINNEKNRDIDKFYSYDKNNNDIKNNDNNKNIEYYEDNNNDINNDENNNIKRDNFNDINDNKFGSLMQNQKENGEKCKTEVNLDDSIENIDSYSNYVKKMKIYSEELVEIYEDMNRNSEILNNIGVSTKINFLDNKNNSTDESIFTDLKNCEIQNVYLESHKKDKVSECDKSNNLDCYQDYNDNFDEKETVSLNKYVNYINKNNSLIDNELEKDVNEKNNNVDLLINDFPRAGIIYPTSDLL